MVEFLKDMLMPSNVTTIGKVAGIVLATFERSRRLGLRLALAACLCFLALSTGVVAAFLLRPLEYKQGAKPISTLSRWTGLFIPRPK